MQTVNMHEAKTHLSSLVAGAVNGQPFIIAKSGKPMVKVVPYVKPKKEQQRFGFYKGPCVIPDDFDTWCADEIAEMFYGATDEQ